VNKMTIQLYRQDMYQKEFTATVIEIQGNRVRLDRTAFYIQGAGQSGDCGTIKGERVIDTQKGGWHLMQNEPTFQVGDTVTGIIDWKRRYNTMRLHSASHIVEYYLIQLIGKKPTIKTNVNYKKDFTDYLMEIPSHEIQEQIINNANEFINKNLNIANIVAVKGKAKNTPTIPNIGIDTDKPKRTQTGCKPILFPTTFGVIIIASKT